MPPEEYYQQQLLSVNSRLDIVKKNADIIAWCRLSTILLLVAAGYMAFSKGHSFLWVATVVLAVALFYILNRQSGLKEQTKRLTCHIKLLNDELNALKGDYSAFYSGESYINVAHPFSYDLDIFGPRSIYQVLNRTVTTNGAHTLAAALQNPYATKDSITERQQAIRELSGKPELLHNFRITGMLHAEEQDADERLQRWLNIDDVFTGNKLINVLLYIVPLLSVLFITLSVIQGTLHPGLILMLAVNWSINIRYSKKIKESHYLVSESVKMIAKSEQLLQQITHEEFTSSALQNIKTDATNAIKSITEFKKLVHLFDNRQNGMVGPLLNSLFMFDVNCMTRLEKWRGKYKNQIAGSLQLVAEMDKCCSYANYTFNHPGNIYPVVNNSTKAITAIGLKHPLIHKDVAVGNDCTLGEQEQFYMLTGANMTGKSTFIRTIGTNIIFAYIGLPVPAVSFNVPLLKIFTSIRITDSVQDDVSYFKAELQRIQELMKEVGNSPTPYLILLDEPLRGTNSTDKQTGTKAIVEKLLSFNAIGIIATHDTSLCAMADNHTGKITNYHFESEVTNGSLQFDYKLKPGGSTSNNATILMHMMGIID